MTRPNILVTCPPMLGLIDEFELDFEKAGLDFTAAAVTQTMSEAELVSITPEHEGWIIGDDPATRRVVQAGAKGSLRAAIKWGVGVDNIDFDAFADCGVLIDNTPGVFGGEVADIATSYAIGLARETYRIDREIRRDNAWPKPSGISIAGRNVAIVGFGDIGSETAKRIAACGGRVIVYDPAYKPSSGITADCAVWPDRLEELDFIIFTCPLNEETRGMFNRDILSKVKPGVRIINVARGPVVDEMALIKGLRSGIVHSAALDVFEIEPLPADSPLRSFDACIFGSHNGSNSADAVRRVSRLAIKKIAAFLK